MLNSQMMITKTNRDWKPKVLFIHLFRWYQGYPKPNWNQKGT